MIWQHRRGLQARERCRARAGKRREHFGFGVGRRDVGVVRQEAARLVLPQLRVVAVQPQQLVVGAVLDDAALLEHDQAIHARDRRQAVRDRDHRLAFHEPEELLLDRELGFAVERRSGLVEHEDRRVLQHHAARAIAM